MQASVPSKLDTQYNKEQKSLGHCLCTTFNLIDSKMFASCSVSGLSCMPLSLLQSAALVVMFSSYAPLLRRTLLLNTVDARHAQIHLVFREGEDRHCIIRLDVLCQKQRH